MVKPPATFASLEGLLDHGRRDGFDIRPTLLRVLTDLYLQKPVHPLEDERYYTELALRLIGSTDARARAGVAARLASYSAAPRPVVLRLARDVVDVAEPILRQSPCLTPTDLEQVARECGAAHAAVIAQRSRPAAVTAAPRPVEILDHPPAEAAELSELFFSASAAERRLVLANLDYTGETAQRLPPVRAKEIVGRLETSALAHNIEAFAREIELAFGISSNLARRITRDELGEPIVAVAKALDAPRAVLERILLFVNPRIGHSVRLVHELATQYDEISIEAALCLIAIWQRAEPRTRETPRPSSTSRRAALDLGRSSATALAARSPPPRDLRARSLLGR